MKHQNKHRERTQALIEATQRRGMAEQADNAIEQQRFKKLIKQGMIIKDKPKKTVLFFKRAIWPLLKLRTVSK